MAGTRHSLVLVRLPAIVAEDAHLACLLQFGTVGAWSRDVSGLLDGVGSMNSELRFSTNGLRHTGVVSGGTRTRLLHLLLQFDSNVEPSCLCLRSCVGSRPWHLEYLLVAQRSPLVLWERDGFDSVLLGVNVFGVILSW